MKSKTHEEAVTTHPTYGMLGFSRVSSSQDVNLFGSPHRHQHYITLTLYQGEVMDTNHHKTYHGGDELFCVSMSAAQFGELVSSFNMGSGVPVTIDHILCKRQGNCPETHDRKEIMDHFEQHMKQVGDRCEALMTTAIQKLRNGKLLKDERLEIIDAITRLVQDTRGNVPYVQALFNEAVDRTIQSAKADIHQFFERSVAKYGLTQLQERLAEALKEPLKLADAGTE